MAKQYAIRSLTEIEGWVKSQCERCACDFWVIPSQAKHTTFCSKLCRNETPEIRFWKKVNKDGPIPEGKQELGKCWVWNGFSDIGIGYAALKVNKTWVRAHRFSFALHNKGIDDSLHVLHVCNNPGCVNPSHLKQGTQKENMAQCHAEGRFLGNRKLSDDQVIEIKISKGVKSIEALAEEYDVSWSSIYNIWHGFNRANV